VCSAVKEFFLKGELPRFYGETKLILIPKIINLERAKDFRPISYCNVYINASQNCLQEAKRGTP